MWVSICSSHTDIAFYYYLHERRQHLSFLYPYAVSIYDGFIPLQYLPEIIYFQELKTGMKLETEVDH